MSKIVVVSSLVFWALIPNTAVAQIIPDSSLGAENSVVDTNGNRDTINGGAIRDANLFHSFQEFNVEALREAYFANPDGIANIFSRVTGNNISDIQGVLGVLGDANLYLINPNGILFGENARLDVNGSFLATTADSVLFENGFEFSTANPDAPPLLTIDIPIGLRFRDNPGDIVNQSVANGVGLSVNEGENIALIGGNVRVENGGILFAPGGRVELGGLVEIGTIGIAEDSSLIFPDGLVRGDVSIIDSSAVAVFSGGGSIGVNARYFNLTNGSSLIAGILTNQGSVDAQAGDISINATETVSLDGQGTSTTGIFDVVLENATGNAGNINIITKNLSLTNGANISAITRGQGNAGNIRVNASDSVFLGGSPDTFTLMDTSVDSSAIGNGGDITIITSFFSLSNGSLSARTSGEGNAGSIALATEQFSVTNGTLSTTSSAGQGNAGKILILASDTLAADNSLIASNLGSPQGVPSVGKVGNIFIAAKKVSFTDTAQIQAGLFSGARGEPGTISVTAEESISFTDENTGILGNTQVGSVGEASNVDITTNSLTFNNGAILSASNSGQGKGGSVTINATNNVFLTNNSGIFARGSEGNSGNIELNTGFLTLDNGAILSARNTGQGKGGNITINAAEQVSLTNGASMSVAGAEGGSINISAQNLSLLNESAFFAGIDIDSGFAEAQSGDIIIKLREDLVVNGLDGENVTSIINNNVGTGNAGKIEITARNISFLNGGNVTSFSNGLGNSGDIILKATENITFDGHRNSSLSGIQSAVTDEGEGASGNITIDAKNLSLTNGASIGTIVGGVGNSGNINLKVRDSVNIDGETAEIELSDGTIGISPSNIKSEVIGLGNSGDINLTTQNLTITNGGNIFASISGQGRAGKINLTINNISVDGRGSNTPSAIESSILLGGIGNGGSIEIATGQFSLSNGASLTTSSAGQGNAGNIFIFATDTFLADDSLIVSNIGSPQGVPAVGKVGNIFIQAREISWTDTAQIQAGFFSGASGESGLVSVKAEDSIVLTGENTGIFSNTEVDAVGNGSDIQLFAPSIFFR